MIDVLIATELNLRAGQSSKDVNLVLSVHKKWIREEVVVNRFGTAHFGPCLPESAIVRYASLESRVPGSCLIG